MRKAEKFRIKEESRSEKGFEIVMEDGRRIFVRPQGVSEASEIQSAIDGANMTHLDPSISGRYTTPSLAEEL